VFGVFLRLGLTSFGGPVAHLGYFRREFVEKRRWLSEDAYADLVALCQFLPGPASSQVGFAIGLQQAGLPGALAAFAGFTAPSAILMLFAATGAVTLPAEIAGPFVHGLVLVAVPVVAHAVFSMAVALCRDVFTAALAVIAFVILLFSAEAWAQPAVIVAAGLLGAIVARPSAGLPAPAQPAHAMPIVSLVLFIALLLGLPLAARIWPAPANEVADAFYRPGALVFGGGHVVLPLLEAETVGRGWLDRETFLAGYGAAQAVPGPLFSFAAFLGSASQTGLPPLLGGLLALVTLFLPGALLVIAALPYWEQLKARRRATGFVRGANAAVVGVLAAALWSPVITSGVSNPVDIVIAIAGFAALQVLKAPSWIVVGLTALAGALSAIWLQPAMLG
jgi:chromate transporter